MFWQTPFWWGKLVREEKYASRHNDRWHNLRQGVLRVQQIYFYIDTWADTLFEAQERNFAIWSGPGEGGEGFWPVTNVFYSFKTYNDEIYYLKKWIGERIIWMDANISRLASKPEPEINISDFFMEQNYPNPFNTSTTFRYYLKEKVAVTLGIYDLLGQKIKILVNEPQGQGMKNISCRIIKDIKCVLFR